MTGSWPTDFEAERVKDKENIFSFIFGEGRVLKLCKNDDYYYICALFKQLDESKKDEQLDESRKDEQVGESWEDEPLIKRGEKEPLVKSLETVFRLYYDNSRKDLFTKLSGDEQPY